MSSDPIVDGAVSSPQGVHRPLATRIASAVHLAGAAVFVLISIPWGGFEYYDGGFSAIVVFFWWTTNAVNAGLLIAAAIIIWRGAGWGDIAVTALDVWFVVTTIVFSATWPYVTAAIFPAIGAILVWLPSARHFARRQRHG